MEMLTFTTILYVLNLPLYIYVIFKMFEILHLEKSDISKVCWSMLSISTFCIFLAILSEVVLRVFLFPAYVSVIKNVFIIISASFILGKLLIISTVKKCRLD